MTKRNLEYSFQGKDKIIEGSVALSKATFQGMHQVSPENNSLFAIDWDNGNFQKLSTTRNDQWIKFSNPGPIGRYSLLIKKGATAHENIVFGDGNAQYTEAFLVWPGDKIDFTQGRTNQEVLVTLLWDGTRYIALATEWFGQPQDMATLEIQVVNYGHPVLDGDVSLTGGDLPLSGMYSNTANEGKATFLLTKGFSYTYLILGNGGVDSEQGTIYVNGNTSVVIDLFGEPIYD